MKNLANFSGGTIVVSDSFCSAIFKQSLYRLFERDSSNQFLKMAFNASMEIFMSKELKVCGLIGPAVSLQKKGTNVSEIEVGISGTNSWRLGSISPRSSYAIYFDLSSTQVTLDSLLLAFCKWISRLRSICNPFSAFKWPDSPFSDHYLSNNC